MSSPKLSRPYACQWTTGIERLNVGPSQRHTLAVRMAVGPGVVGSVHLDEENSTDLIAYLCGLMSPQHMPRQCLVYPGDKVKVMPVNSDVEESPAIEIRVGRGSAVLSIPDAKAIAIELLRLSNG